MRFVLLAWLLSRATIAVVFFIVSPHPLASAGNWDGAWYGSIAQHGYGYAKIGAQRDIAYFPLYPMLAWVVMRAGIGWPLAGVLVNNAAFLAALFVIYNLTRQHWNVATARWCVAFACANPLSLFTAVAYHEGTFLLFSAIALRMWLRRRWFPGGLAAAAASATSAFGVALGVALVTDAVVRRRSAAAVASAAIAFAGIGAFALFCYLRFGDPLAFAHAQTGWRTSGLDVGAWLRVVASLRTWQGFCQNIMVVVLVPGAALAMIFQLRSLGLTLSAYGLAAIALILIVGEPISADRYAYAIVPVLIVLARVLQRVPVIGIAALAALLALLAYDSAQFARFHWVA